MWRAHPIDGAEAWLIRQIVAKKGHRIARTDLVNDRSYGAALISAGAQFNARLERQQRKSLHLCRGLKECSRLLFNHLRALR